MKTKYIRLLSYQNALKVIKFLTEQKNESYAYITSGGLTLKYEIGTLVDVENYIKSLGVRYEIVDEHPTKVNQRIVKNLRDSGTID